MNDTTQIASPDTGIANNTFDAAGNLTSHTDARGAVTRYSYDALNRMTRKTYGATTVTYRWDSGANAIGQLSDVTDASGASHWHYDAMQRVAAKTQRVNGITLSHRYQYDRVGHLVRQTYPSGNTVAYHYNVQGQIDGIAINGKPLFSQLQYQPFGAANRWIWGNGLAYTRNFDADGRLASLPLGSDTRTLGYDAASRIVTLTDSQPAVSQLVQYDNLDRVTGWIAPAANQGYQYDANGNRTSLVNGTTATSYTYPATSNRLASISNGQSTDNISYDAMGNTLAAAGLSYQYDASGRLASATNNRRTITFALNGLGQRVSKHSGADTLFTYDPAGHLTGDYDAHGAALTETIYLGDLPVAVMRDGAAYYVYTDQLNTPRLITSPANIPLWRWLSSPFGDDPADDNPSRTRRFSYNPRFPGQYYDVETGLHYNYYRDYDPGMGRYVESDPVGLVGGDWSGYAYGNGNPVSYVDPLGLDVTIIINRTTYTPISIIGIVNVTSTVTDQNYSGYTLENASPPNPNLPVPPGAYSATVRADYIPNRVELNGVPNASGIEIHTGNTAANVIGCFAVGSSAAQNFVGGSVNAMTQINNIISADGTGNITVIVNGGASGP